MRVLLINTSEMTGGAAVATKRLLAALNNNGEKAKMLVRYKQTSDLSVVGIGQHLKMRFCFLWERLCIFLHLHMRMEHLWEIDIANVGADITTMREFKEADVIHLAWINQGMLSLDGIKKILQSGKPVVWTMHDLWPATSLCHYARGCDKYKVECHDCKLLPGSGSPKDLSHKLWNKKRDVYGAENIHFVTCSRWLERQARESGLLQGQPVTSIPNPIDSNVFTRQDKQKARKSVGLPVDKNIILFVSQKVTDQRKGAQHLVDALEKLKKQNPSLAANSVVALLGGHAEELAAQIPLDVIPLGYVSGDKNLAQVYNAADVFVLPSLEDNLPNTIMEALACGVPCVGFNVGGIPEMIQHQKNGYVAAYENPDDLMTGIIWVLTEADREALSKEAQALVAKNYSQQAVALKYIDVYSEAMARRRYRI